MYNEKYKLFFELVSSVRQSFPNSFYIQRPETNIIYIQIVMNI